MSTLPKVEVKLAIYERRIVCAEEEDQKCWERTKRMMMLRGYDLKNFKVVSWTRKKFEGEKLEDRQSLKEMQMNLRDRR
jgi:hypothetical protein